MTVYKICTATEWDEAVERGALVGSAVDLADGFIHLSAADQVADTAAKHFAGLTDLVLIGVEETELGDALRWEPSRGGALFPHLYATLPVTAASLVRPIPLDEAGTHVLGEL